MLWLKLIRVSKGDPCCQPFYIHPNRWQKFTQFNGKLKISLFRSNANDWRYMFNHTRHDIMKTISCHFVKHFCNSFHQVIFGWMFISVSFQAICFTTFANVVARLTWNEKNNDADMTWNNFPAFRINGPLSGDFIRYWWIPSKRINDTKLCCFLGCLLYQALEQLYQEPDRYFFPVAPFTNTV